MTLERSTSCMLRWKSSRGASRLVFKQKPVFSVEDQLVIWYMCSIGYSLCCEVVVHPNNPSMNRPRSCSFGFRAWFPKHCQRHNRPEGWVLITSSITNLDQISSSESRPSIIFKTSTKYQPLHKTWASKSWPNLASESRPTFNFITSTKHQQKKTG